MKPHLEDFDGVAQIAAAISNPKKCLILALLKDGASTTDISRECGVTRQGLQRHIDALMMAQMIAHGREQYYVLTLRGEAALEGVRALKKLDQGLKATGEEAKDQEVITRISGLIEKGKLSPSVAKELKKALRSSE